jgi:hypothetical protein
MDREDGLSGRRLDGKTVVYMLEILGCIGH